MKPSLLDQWQNVQTGYGTWNLLPSEDIIDHKNSPFCICGPRLHATVAADGYTVFWQYEHHSLDGREFVEQGLS